jgi:hypothetical protein
MAHIQETYIGTENIFISVFLYPGYITVCTGLIFTFASVRTRNLTNVE